MKQQNIYNLLVIAALCLWGFSCYNSQRARVRDLTMSTYKLRVRGDMLTNQPQSPLAGLPGVPVQDVRINTDFRYLIFRHPNLTAAIARRDFQLAFVSNPKRYQKMHDLGFEGVRYSNGVQEWTFDFG